MNKMIKVELNGWALLSILVGFSYGVVSMVSDMAKIVTDII